MNAPDQSTALTVQARASVAKVETALSEFDKIEAGLAELRSKYAGVVYPVTSAAGMREATDARAEIREPRYKTEHARKAGKAPVLELGRNIEQRAAYITEELLKIETPINQQIRAEEDRKEREREAKAKAEQNRIAKIQADIEEIKALLIEAAGASSVNIAVLMEGLRTSEGCAWAEEFQDVAEQVKIQTMNRLQTMHAAAVEHEAEQERIKAERAELERQKAEQAERERVAEKERQAREREEKKAMDEAIARRVAEDKAAREKLEAAERERKRKELEHLDARAALVSFRERFGHLPEFSHVLKAIEDYLTEHPEKETA